MAVGIRGSTQLSWVSTSGALTLPAGTTAGDLAVVFCDWPTSGDAGPAASGWRPVKQATWWKLLTAADVSGGLGVWNGRLLGLVVFTGARDINNVSSRRGVRLTEAGAVLLVEGWTDYYTAASTMNPATNRLGSAVKGYRDQYLAWWAVTGLAVGDQSIAYDSNSMGYRAFEVRPAKAPDAPTPTGPSGQVDSTGAVTLTWSPTAPQEGFKVRAKPSSSGTWQYLTSGGALNASEQLVTSAVSSLTCPVGTFTSVPWDWAVSTQNSGNWSAYSASAQFTPTSPPSAAVTLTTTAGSLSAGISWTPTTPTGAETAWQAAILPAALAFSTDAAVWMSPVTAGTATATTVPAQSTWTNGGSYRAWVRVQQTGGMWSAWTSSTAQTISWTPPPAPGSIVVADSAGEGQPLTVTIATIPTSSVSLEVESSPDQVEWVDLATVALPNATEVVPNPVAPYLVAQFYRTRVWATVSGVLVPSAWVVSTAVATTDQGAYLVDPDDVTDYLHVELYQDSPRALVQGVTVAYGLGSDRPMTTRTPPAGEAGSTTLATLTAAKRAAVVTWLSTRDSWLFRWPPESAGSAVEDSAPTLMALADRVSWTRFLQRPRQERFVSFDWVEA